MAIEIKLQELKENVEIVEVNAIKVAVGDLVAKGQPLLEVQADKAALEVPSPQSGTITQILVKVGDQVKIGQAYIHLDGANGVVTAPAKAEAKPAPAAAKPAVEVKPAPVAATPAPVAAPVVVATMRFVPATFRTALPFGAAILIELVPL